jgi:hypothetical protein
MTARSIRRPRGSAAAHTDVVTASGFDDDEHAVSAQDDATVTITDAPSSIQVTKTANPTSIQEPGGTVSFAVSVKNTSGWTRYDLSLVDNVYGNLDGKEPVIARRRWHRGEP